VAKPQGYLVIFWLVTYIIYTYYLLIKLIPRSVFVLKFPDSFHHLSLLSFFIVHWPLVFFSHAVNSVFPMQIRMKGISSVCQGCVALRDIGSHC
jgi:hypothetical protein